MSDSDQSTLDPHPGPSLFTETRSNLRELIDLLRQVDERLEHFGRRLPKPGPEFNHLAELRSGMDCVRQDLLADALETLHLIATLPEDELQKRFEERRTWLA
jgi:hypothetical protein